jgi:hypothetical protein
MVRGISRPPVLNFNVANRTFSLKVSVNVAGDPVTWASAAGALSSNFACPNAGAPDTSAASKLNKAIFLIAPALIPPITQA